VPVKEKRFFAAAFVFIFGIVTKVKLVNNSAQS
jgi:hypothetical protein